MITKKITIFLALFLFLIILTACKSSNNLESSKETGNKFDQNFKRPDFGQPEEEVDIRGIISSITGNEIKILKIERSQFSREENKDNKSTKSLSMSSSASTPRMGGGMRGNRQSMSQDDRDQMIERIKKMATGEETVLIPVGIQMLKPDTDNSEEDQKTMVEASLEDIKKDIMVQIWLNKDITDRKVAKFVLISN